MLGSPPAGYSGPMTYEALTKAGVPLLAYGNFITVALNFVILAFIIFLMVRQINRLQARAPPAAAGPAGRRACCCARSATRSRKLSRGAGRSGRRDVAAFDKSEEEFRCYLRKRAAGALPRCWPWRAALSPVPAQADINVGVTLSATGPAASLGIPEKNTFELLPPTIAGQKVNCIVLDDASDTTEAVKNTRKLITEDKVDVIVGSTITPNSLAMRDVVVEAEMPMISLAASARIINPANPKTKWVFKTPQNDSLMADAIAVHMKANGVKTLGYIGFADAYGDSWLAEIRSSAQTAGIKIVAEEKYNRNDPSVTGQVLKLVAAKPDAILIAAAGTPGATPQKELVARGYKGKIYQTHGVANADFLRVVGKDGNGTLLPVGPMLVYEQLPDSNPVKKSAADYVTKYEAKYGPDSRTTFGGHAWDAYLLLQQRDSGGAEESAARHQGVPRRVARRARKREGSRRDARRVHDDAERPQRLRQPRAGDGQDRQRQMGSGQVAPG